MVISYEAKCVLVTKKGDIYQYTPLVSVNLAGFL